VPRSRIVAEVDWRHPSQACLWLYYRISTVEIKLPGLSRRREDLPLLEQRFATQYNKPIRGITRMAQLLLARHSWPGNVRELENVLAHACMMARGEAIDVTDLPDTVRNRHASMGDWDPDLCSLEEVQRRHIQRVLMLVNDNKVQAAEILGIGRTTLYRLLAGNTTNREDESRPN
jgi:two-component system, NtrC family, response regulator HydG